MPLLLLSFGQQEYFDKFHARVEPKEFASRSLQINLLKINETPKRMFRKLVKHFTLMIL